MKRHRWPALAAIVFIIQVLVGGLNLECSETTEIALFYSRGFPTVDSLPITLFDLEEALKGLDYKIISRVKDFETLEPVKCRLLLLPYGSAFPLEAWVHIRRYLEQGGNLLVLGGAPFHQPVLWDKELGQWQRGIRQPTFAQELLIGPAEKITIPPSSYGNLSAGYDPSFSPIAAKLSTLKPDHVYAMTVRFTVTKDFPQEDGSTGPYLARMRPLVHLLDKQGIPRYCPVLEIDRILGSQAGGRWVFAPAHTEFSPAWIRALASRALQGAQQLEIHPVKASLKPGEYPEIRVRMGQWHTPTKTGIPYPFQVKVTKEKGKIIMNHTLEAHIKGAEDNLLIAFPGLNNLAPGIYKVSARMINSPNTAATCGFCIPDEELLFNGPKLSASRDWLRLDSKVFPVIGTTYMGSNAHRKFLLNPAPQLWHQDFHRMAGLGINFVRTGIWTGWSDLTTPEGQVKEEVLRALDAYVQCAAVNNIMVSFTFFAFLPPTFGGVNPYLDPVSLAGQKAFIQNIARRYRGIHWIHFDLINEPSYASPKDLWLTRPMGDDHEKIAWRKWLSRRHGPNPARISSHLHDSRKDPFALPQPRDFSYARVKGGASPLRALEFILFSRQVFSNWTGTLRESLHLVAPEAPVTVGQDEGGTGTRPSQQFFAPQVDYTSVHSWWYNDDLLWDGMVTRVPEKPNLVSETGMMRLEDMNGMPWRTPKDAASLLERKYAMAFMARGAGAVQWIWDINPYMPLDNEAVIGSFRVDGTAKPELDVLSNFADFFKKAAPYLDDFEAHRVVVVLPHSRLYASRPRGLDASKKIIRLLADHFDTFPLALSEYQLSTQRIEGAQLLILPVAEILNKNAAQVILAAAQKGTKVLITGPLKGNPYGEITPALHKLGAKAQSLPLAFHEPYGDSQWVSFGAGISQFIGKAPHPRGKRSHPNILHEPLPLEFSGNNGPLITLLDKALNEAGLPANYSPTPLPCRLLYAPKAVLGICVNETARTLTKTIPYQNQKISITLGAGKARLFLLDRTTGKLLVISPSHKHL